jgi:hypothetical protein
MAPERPLRSWRACGFGVAFALIGCRTEGAHSDNGPRAGQIDYECPVAQLPSTLRRLTRFEYAAALEDVFGITVEIEAVLPRDEVVDGFDNHAESLGVAELHVEAYLKLAEQVGARVAADPALPAHGACGDFDVECARTRVASWGARLFRRSLTDRELAQLIALFADDFSEPGFREGAELVISALLQSPSFLYRLDGAATAAVDDGAGARPLASPETLASRLAFLFWSSVPDRELAGVAAAGRLASAKDVAREARRLWKDERTKRSLWHFHEQWLGLSDFLGVEKNPRLFAFWDSELRRDLALETRQFVLAVLQEDDARLTTLLTAPNTFANPRLRDFYGFKPGGAAADAFERLDFPALGQRLGLLTQGSLLSAHAEVDQTSPVLRGKFVIERFFCKSPPPPPPNLAVSPPVLDPRLTTRQRFDRHRTDPGCAGCHQFLDPIGFGFEHFDASGHYRETESGAPIDARGFLVGTDVDGEFDGAKELSHKLAASEDVRRCVVSHWFRYAFGRAETPEESCSLERLANVFRDSGGSLEELVVGLTQLEAFLSPSSAAAGAGSR